jgi:transcription initiation factor TFIIB
MSYITDNNDKSVNDKSVNDKSVNDKSVNDKSVNDKSVNDKSVNDKSVNDKSVSINDKKSKKKKDNALSIQHKSKLWNVFETEVTQRDKPQEPLERLYNRTAGDREFCELCQYSLAFSDEGFLTCTNNKCGIIYKDILDSSPEWRYYGTDDNQNSDPTRCGMPINPFLEESSFGCKVLCSSGNSSYEMRKIKRYTEWQSMPYKEKSQYDEFQRITVYANNAGISKKIIDDAIKYHKKICEYEQTFRGDNKDGIIAASIYISCRINNYPRTAKELATIFNLDVTSATQGCKNAQTILNILEKDMDNKDKTSFCKPKPQDFIERYCSKLNINSELTKLCHFIAIKIEKNNLMQENTPHSIAAGIVYFITQLCKLNVSKKEVTNISELSEVTINKCCKKLEKMTDELVPSVFLNKYRDVSV